MELQIREVGGGAHAALMTGAGAFMTESVLLEVFRYISCANRPLSEDLQTLLAPSGGVTYLEWLLGRLLPVTPLPTDEKAILEGLLKGQSHAAIGAQLRHDRNWVADRIRRRLVPRLVPLINAAVTQAQYSLQAMLCHQLVLGHDMKQKG